MEQYKKEFIEFMTDSDVLKFGEFTLKSGRKSPFFMNAGGYVTGSQLMKLGPCEKGQSVYVDSEKRELMQANIGLMAVELEADHHVKYWCLERQLL